MDLSKIQMLLDAAAVLSGSSFPDDSEPGSSDSTVPVQATPSVASYEECTSAPKQSAQNSSTASIPEADASFRNVHTSTPKRLLPVDVISAAVPNPLTRTAEPSELNRSLVASRTSQGVGAGSSRGFIGIVPRHGSFIEAGSPMIYTEPLPGFIKSSPWNRRLGISDIFRQVRAGSSRAIIDRSPHHGSFTEAGSQTMEIEVERQMRSIISPSSRNRSLTASETTQGVGAESCRDVNDVSSRHGSFTEVVGRRAENHAGRQRVDIELSRGFISQYQRNRSLVASDVEQQREYIGPDSRYAPLAELHRPRQTTAMSRDHMGPDLPYTESDRQREIAVMSRYFGPDSIYRLVSELHRQEVANETLRNFILSDVWNRSMTASDRRQDFQEMSRSLIDPNPQDMPRTFIDSDLRETSFAGTSRQATDRMVGNSSTDFEQHEFQNRLFTVPEGQRVTERPRNFIAPHLRKQPMTAPDRQQEFQETSRKFVDPGLREKSFTGTSRQTTDKEVGQQEVQTMSRSLIDPNPQDMPRTFIDSDLRETSFAGTSRQATDRIVGNSSTDFEQHEFQNRLFTVPEGQRATERPRNFIVPHLRKQPMTAPDRQQEFQESRKFVDSGLREKSFTETSRQTTDRKVGDSSAHFTQQILQSRFYTEPERQRVAEKQRDFTVPDLWNRPMSAPNKQQEFQDMSRTFIDSDLREKSFVGTSRQATGRMVGDPSTEFTQQEVQRRLFTEHEGQKVAEKPCDFNIPKSIRSPDRQRECEETLVRGPNHPTKLSTETSRHITDRAIAETSRDQNEPIQESNLAAATADNAQSHNSDALDSDYEDVDDDAHEIIIGDLTLFNEFIIEEYFEKYENQTLMNDDDDDRSCEGKENKAVISGNEHRESLDPGESACNTELPSGQPLVNVQLQNGDLGFEELNENPAKKQKVNPRKASQIARMKGIQYTRTDNVVIPARSVKLPCSCAKLKCYTKYSDAMRHKLLENLLRLTTSGQNQFLSNHMSIRTTARPKPLMKSRRVFTRAYYLPAVNGRVHVCKEMFMSTFDVKDKRLRTLADKKIVGAGVSADDYRTKNRSKKALNESDIDYIEQHIRSFPAYTSHYARERSGKLYLSSDLSVRRMYDLFKTKCLENNKQAVHYSTYRIIFKRMNISFRKLKVDTCCKCDKFAISIKIAAGPEERAEIEQLKNTHHDEAQEAYRQKKCDVQKAKIDGRYRTASFDLQKCLPTPHLTTGIAFYSRQLYTYNLTVFSTNREANTVTCYLWDESKGRRGSQEIGSCLLKDLESIDRSVEVIIYYSDRCAGQNHNIVIGMMFSYFIEKCISMGRKMSIEHKFMCTGHSHMEVDSAHGAIEKAKKRCSMNIETPRDWAVFIAAINRKIPFTVIEMEQREFLALKSLDAFYKRAKKNVDGDTVRFHDISVFKYTTDNPGTVYYKYKLGDSEFSSFSMNRDLKDPVVLPSPLTDEPIPLAEEKLEDLRKLMDFVSNKAYYQTLLKQIVPKKRGRRTKTEKSDHFEADLDLDIEEQNFVEQ